VEENARAMLYGTMDVELCPHTLDRQKPDYQSLAATLPRPAHWYVTPLMRTRHTAQAIINAGYGDAELHVESGLIEQCMGDWQGLPHGDLPQHLAQPAHPFWPLSGTERPPHGESMQDTIARVGPAMERLAAAHQGQDVVIVSHGGAIRAALAHALGIAADNALHISIQNISLTKLDRLPRGWRINTVNALV
jgi:broad specificity phosphatase PhoE